MKDFMQYSLLWRLSNGSLLTCLLCAVVTTGSLYVLRPCYCLRCLLCPLSGKNLCGECSLFLLAGISMLLCNSRPYSELGFVFSESAPQWGCCRCHLHGSRQLRTRAFHIFDRSGSVSVFLQCIVTVNKLLISSCLFISGVFITKGDLGVGTIVGSAVFNILVIIGVCGIFSGQVDYACFNILNIKLYRFTLFVSCDFSPFLLHRPSFWPGGRSSATPPSTSSLCWPWFW